MPSKTLGLVSDLLTEIDSAVSTFNKSVPNIQRQTFEKIQTLLKDLQLNGDRILNSVDNNAAIGKLKSEIEKIILNPKYIKQVASFAKAFDVISTLQNKIFSAQVADFKPKAVLNAIKKDAVKATVVKLTEAGISSKVTEGIQGILRTNIQSKGGGKFSDMMEQMRTFITTDEKGLGALERYTKQITTDSLNQYSAVYNQTVSADLGLKWRMYVGSNLATTRAFCEALAEKKYYHIDDLPEILKGHIDGKTIKINPKTGVWAGGIPGTTVDNFANNRGGYNCGHQDFGITEAMVPKDILARHNGIPAPPTPPKPEPSNQSLTDESFIKKFPQKIDPKVFAGLTKKADITFSENAGSTLLNPSGGTYHDPATGKIFIKDDERFRDSKWVQKTMVYHETGHAIHTQRNLITSDFVSPEIKALFKSCQLQVRGDMKGIGTKLNDHLKKALKTQDWDLLEQTGVALDVLGSLSYGNAGRGHTLEYYNTNNGAYKELFAHGTSTYFTGNKVLKETMPEVEKILKEYFDKFYSNL